MDKFRIKEEITEFGSRFFIESLDENSNWQRADSSVFTDKDKVIASLKLRSIYNAECLDVKEHYIREFVKDDLHQMD